MVKNQFSFRKMVKEHRFGVENRGKSRTTLEHQISIEIIKIVFWRKFIFQFTANFQFSVTVFVDCIEQLHNAHCTSSAFFLYKFNKMENLIQAAIFMYKFFSILGSKCVDHMQIV